MKDVLLRSEIELRIADGILLGRGAFPFGCLECGCSLLFSFVNELPVFVTALLLHFNDESALGLAGLRLNNVMVIAMRAVLIRLFELGDFFAEGALAFLAEENHVHGGHQLVVLSPMLRVALGAVEPFFAAGGSHGDLRIQNVFAHTCYLSNFLYLKY